MQKSLRDHLVRCEKAIQSAKPILGIHGFPTDNRTLTVIGFISGLVEYQESILLLVMHNMPGSASALLRPVVESGYRALWINLPATEKEVQRFNEKDEIDLTFGEMAKSLDSAYGTDDFFEHFKARTWKHLNSYTHGGMHQIGRRFSNHEVANNYSEEELYEITTTATTMVLLAIMCLLKKHGHIDSGNEVEALMATYGPMTENPNPE